MFWTARLLRPGRPVDNRVMKVEWRLALDPDAFGRALQALVERTDSLRLVFDEEDGVPYQYALKTVDPALEVRDFTGERDPYTAANAWLDQRSGRVLDLAKRVFETALARLGPDHWIWHLNQHHIATDFTSAALILRRLSDLYRQALKGAVPTALPYPSYLDFLSRHPAFTSPGSKKITSPRYTQDPPARLYPAAGTGHGATKPESVRMLRREVYLGSDRLTRARAFLGLKDRSEGNAARGNASLFNLFAATSVAFTARLSGQRSVTVGTPTHNRYLEGSKEIAGLFIRMLPLYVELEEDWTFHDLMRALQKERRTVFTAAKSGKVLPKRGYNIGLNFIGEAMPDFCGVQSRDLTTKRDTETVGLDLNLTIRAADKPGDVKLLFDVNEEIVDIVGTEEVSAQYLRVFDALLEDPESRIDFVPIAGPTEQSRACAAARRAIEVPAPPWRTLPEGFLRNVYNTPAAEALREGDVALSYAELETRTRSVCRGLQRLGIRAGECVALQLPRSLDLVVAMLGIMRSGAAVCALEIGTPEARARSIIADTRATFVVTRRDVVTEPGLESVTRVMLEDLSAVPAADMSVPDIDPRGPAYVMFTSGTTGVPKGVVVPHECFARFLSWKHTRLFRGETISWAFSSSIAFEASLRMFVALVSGGAIRVYPDPQSVGELALARVMQEDTVDAAFTTPSQLRLLVDRRWSLSRLQYLCVVGEPLTRSLALKAQRALGSSVEIQNWYGPTEGTMSSTAYRFDPERDTGPSVPIGRPAPDVTVYILDRGLNPVPPGVTGEIYIGGARLSDGYLNRPDWTREKFLPDPFRPGGRLYCTGDLGRIDRDGNVVHHGRTDDQVKINGVRIELSDVEHAVCAHPRIKACAAALTKRNPPRLAAWYVAEQDVPPEEIRSAAARHATGPMIPSLFVRLHELPLNRNGKVDRRALPSVDTEPVTGGGTAPRTATEETLVYLWRRILGNDRIGIDDHFFDLGGDSLTAFRLVHEVEDQYGIRLPVESLDRITTIADFACFVDEVLTTEYTSTAVRGSVADTAATSSDLDPDVLRALQVFMTGWEGERVDDNALMFGLNTNGRLPPLFWCFNSAQEFSEMARHLGAEQPLYGVRSLSGVLPSKKLKIRHDQALAERHAREILRHHSNGPLFIGGNCQSARIALRMARYLINHGKSVNLLCMLEQAPQVAYPGRVALFFGRDSKKHNPFKRLSNPEIGWRRYYREVVWDVVPGAHRQYFREPNVGPLCERIAARLEETRATLSDGTIAKQPDLVPPGRQTVKDMVGNSLPTSSYSWMRSKLVSLRDRLILAVPLLRIVRLRPRR